MDTRKREKLEDMTGSYKNKTQILMKQTSNCYVYQPNQVISKNLSILEVKDIFPNSVIEHNIIIDHFGNKLLTSLNYDLIIRNQSEAQYAKYEQKSKCSLNSEDGKIHGDVQNSLLDLYIYHAISYQYDRKLKISHDPSSAEIQLRKFLRVCGFLPPEFELSTGSNENLRHYFLIADLLNHCHQINVSNSSIIVGLLKLVLRMHIDDSNTTISQHTSYLPDFFKYILYHVNKADFDLGSYISEYCNTVWNCAVEFSVLDAVASADKERLSDLLDSGFDVFPDHERKKCEHRFHNVKTTIPASHMMILDLMKRINDFYVFKTSPLQITRSHLQCFKLLWLASPQFHISANELLNSVKKLLPMKESKSNFYRKMERFANLYEVIYHKLNNFRSNPCLLQRLCTTPVRKLLRKIQRYPKLDPLNVGQVWYAYKNNGIEKK